MLRERKGGVGMKLKLYRVTYKIWNPTFSGLIPREALAIGVHEADAIQRLRAEAERDAREFEATVITEVQGHRIIVE